MNLKSPANKNKTLDDEPSLSTTQVKLVPHPTIQQRHTLSGFALAPGLANDPLEKRKAFAIALRRVKKAEIFARKRARFYSPPPNHTKRQSTTDQKPQILTDETNPTHLDEFLSLENDLMFLPPLTISPSA